MVPLFYVSLYRKNTLLIKIEIERRIIMTIPEYLTVYERTDADINYLWYDVVLEADGEGIDDDANKQSKSIRFSDRLKIIMDHLISMIEKAILSIANSLKRINLTDSGFKKQLRQAEVEVKPLNAVKVVSYKYINQVLDTENQKFTSIIHKAITSLSNMDSNELDNESNPLNMEHKALEEYVLKEMHCPSDINDMTMYFLYLKRIFRGEKGEQTILQSTLPEHKRMVAGYDTFKRDLESSKASMVSEVNKIKSQLMNVVRNNNVPDEIKVKRMSQMKNISFLYNMYSTFIGCRFQLKVEQMLTSREILKRFYQI